MCDPKRGSRPAWPTSDACSTGTACSTVLAARQEGPKRDLLEDLQHRQNTAELQRHVRSMHAADVAYALEALPLDDRRSVWDQVTDEQAARVFVEVDAVVRESLVDVTPPDAHGAPADVARPRRPRLRLGRRAARRAGRGCPAALASADRTVFEDSRLYQNDSVGFFMTREWVAVPETHTVEHAIHDLRARGRAAAADRSPVRRRRASRAGRQRAAAGAARAAARRADPRSDEPRHADLRAARPGRRRREGVRALRPGVGAGRRRPRQDRRPAHGRCGHGRDARTGRPAGPAHGRSARRRRSVRRAAGQRPQPLAVARHQPGDRLRRLARHRPVRSPPSAAWRRWPP